MVNYNIHRIDCDMANVSTRYADRESAATSPPSSIWLWLLRPVALALISVGLVMIVAGITSFSVNGMENKSYILLTPTGGFILSFGSLLGIGVLIRLREEKKMLAKARQPDNGVLDLTTEFAAVEISVDRTSFVEISAHGDGWNPEESIPGYSPRPLRYEDVVLANSVAPLPAVTSAVASEEMLLALEDLNQFESPPSYEEATSGENGV